MLEAALAFAAAAALAWDGWRRTIAHRDRHLASDAAVAGLEQKLAEHVDKHDKAMRIVVEQFTAAVGKAEPADLPVVARLKRLETSVRAPDQPRERWRQPG